MPAKEGLLEGQGLPETTNFNFGHSKQVVKVPLHAALKYTNPSSHPTQSLCFTYCHSCPQPQQVYKQGSRCLSLCSELLILLRDKIRLLYLCQRLNIFHLW